MANGLFVFTFVESHSMLVVKKMEVKTQEEWQGRPFDEPEISRSARKIKGGFFWGEGLTPYKLEFFVLETDGECSEIKWQNKPTLLESLLVAILEDKAVCHVFEPDEFNKFREFIIKQETFKEPGMEHALLNNPLQYVAEDVFGVELD